MPDKLQPQTIGERIAIFRAQMVGALVCRELKHGELGPLLEELSRQPVRPPGSDTTRVYSVPTLRRWYSRFRKHGIDGLRPASRERGFALNLSKQDRELIKDIRRSRPDVSVTVLLRTLEADGRLQENAVSAPTLRRMLSADGLDRQTLRQATGDKTRRARWEAESPGALWHSDVCHGPALRVGKRNIPLRIHAILDDSSRYVVGIQACNNEREVEMLTLFCKTLRRFGPPRVLYLDNGSTYCGEALATACARLGVVLVHAKPYDPQARGKMERFWRTLREGCLDHIGHLESLHDVQVRLLAFLDQHYHNAPHAGLMGKSPAQKWETEPHADNTLELVGEDLLNKAFTVRGQRRVKRDGTLMVGGVIWEVDQGFLAGRNVTVAREMIAPQRPPWVEHGGKVYSLHIVRPVNNAARGLKTSRVRTGIDAVDFDPAGALLRQILGQTKNKSERNS
jgi:transposase InsO family protein